MGRGIDTCGHMLNYQFAHTGQRDMLVPIAGLLLLHSRFNLLPLSFLFITRNGFCYLLYFFDHRHYILLLFFLKRLSSTCFSRGNIIQNIIFGHPAFTSSTTYGVQLCQCNSFLLRYIFHQWGIKPISSTIVYYGSGSTFLGTQNRDLQFLGRFVGSIIFYSGNMAVMIMIGLITTSVYFYNCDGLAHLYNIIYIE